MPVYNGERFLRHAVDSILRQTYREFEFIIVDDGSTDGTARILDGYADRRIVRLRHERNQGLIASLNFGLDAARGELIARQDADDISLPQRLESEVRVMAADARIVLAGSSYLAIDEHGKRLRPVPLTTHDTAIRWHMLFMNSFAHSSVMMRATALAQHGLRYDPGALHVEDYALWSQLMRHGRIVNISEPLLEYRVHGEQVSQIASARQAEGAVRIAAANIRRLGIEISDSDAAALSAWFTAFPFSLDGDNLRLCRKLCEIFGTFAGQQHLDAATVGSIRWHTVHRILSRLSPPWRSDAWRSGLLRDLFVLRPALTARAVCSARVRARMSQDDAIYSGALGGV
jgi:hypothetical protein